MTVLINRISLVINAFVYCMQYVGTHINDYPGILFLVSALIVIFAVQLIKSFE